MRALRLAIVALLLAFQAVTAHADRFHVVKHQLPAVVAGLSVTYDTRFGTGNVTVNGTPGWFSFPLHSGNRAIYVDSGSGSASDSGACTSAAAPCLTIDGAFTKFTTGFTAGDHLRIAGTGSRSYTQSATGVFLAGLAGISEAYPTAIESYDPGDPTNTARYGKLVGTDMPIIHVHGSRFSVSSCTASYIAFQGLDFEGDDQDGAGITYQCNMTGAAWQNDRFNGIGLTIQGGATYDATAASYMQDVNVSKSTFIGTYASCCNMQTLYVHAVNGLHLENNTFWHSGWRVGASRDDAQAIGGVQSGSNHAHYISATNAGTVISGNFYADSAFDGMNDRGPATISSVASLDEPQVGYLGNFSGSNREAPDGITIHFNDGLMMGSSRLNSSIAGGDGYWTTNTLAGSYVHNIAAFDNPSPSYMINSFNPQLYTAASITHSGTTATVALTGHGLLTGDKISVYNASPTEYNVTNAIVTVIDANTFTYPMLSAPATNATAVGQMSPLPTQYLLLDNVHAYSYSGHLQGTVASTNNTWTSTIADQLAPGGGNSTSTVGTFPGYKTRDQVITAVLTGVGITPGATYYVRKGQLMNAAMTRPDLPWAQWLIGVGFPAMSLTPTYTTPAYQTFTDTPLTMFKSSLTDLTPTTLTFVHGVSSSVLLGGVSALPVLSSADMPSGCALSGRSVTCNFASAGSYTAHVDERSQDDLSGTFKHTTTLTFNVSFLPLFAWRRRKRKAANDNTLLEMVA